MVVSLTSQALWRRYPLRFPVEDLCIARVRGTPAGRNAEQFAFSRWHTSAYSCQQHTAESFHVPHTRDSAYNSNWQQFKVIQGHQSWCQSKAHMQLPISHFGRISYCFRDIDAFSSKIYVFPTPPLCDTPSWGTTCDIDVIYTLMKSIFNAYISVADNTGLASFV